MDHVGVRIQRVPRSGPAGTDPGINTTSGLFSTWRQPPERHCICPPHVINLVVCMTKILPSARPRRLSASASTTSQHFNQSEVPPGRAMDGFSFPNGNHHRWQPCRNARREGQPAPRRRSRQTPQRSRPPNTPPMGLPRHTPLAAQPAPRPRLAAALTPSCTMSTGFPQRTSPTSLAAKACPPNTRKALKSPGDGFIIYYYH